MTKDQERSFIEQAKKGDEESFEALILSCKKKAYNIAFRYMGNEEDAADVLQDSLVKAFCGLRSFRGDSSFDTWIYRIVVNTANDRLRQRSRSGTVPLLNETDFLAELTDPAPLPEEAVLQREETEYILSCIRLMRAEHRDMIVLRDIQGLAYEQIAQIVGVPAGTVKSRISRARKELREIYTAGGGNKAEKASSKE